MLEFLSGIAAQAARLDTSAIIDLQLTVSLKHKMCNGVLPSYNDKKYPRMRLCDDIRCKWTDTAPDPLFL
jgi:hypothetical protein